jgi:hypothetical protein
MGLLLRSWYQEETRAEEDFVEGEEDVELRPTQEGGGDDLSPSPMRPKSTGQHQASVLYRAGPPEGGCCKACRQENRRRRRN